MLDKISEMGIKADEKVAREILKQRTNILVNAHMEKMANQDKEQEEQKTLEKKENAFLKELKEFNIAKLYSKTFIDICLSV
jgi:hypothetical protein